MISRQRRARCFSRSGGEAEHLSARHRSTERQCAICHWQHLLHLHQCRRCEKTRDTKDYLNCRRTGTSCMDFDDTMPAVAESVLRDRQLAVHQHAPSDTAAQTATRRHNRQPLLSSAKRVPVHTRGPVSAISLDPRPLVCPLRPACPTRQ